MAAAVRVYPARRPRWRRPVLVALAAVSALVLAAAALPWSCAALPDEAEVINRGGLADEEASGRGRAAFYTEDLGDAAFLTDRAGLLAGPLRPWSVLRALAGLRGAGTTNLQVALAEDATIGGQVLARGARIDTGLDVAAGSLLPLGVAVHVSRLRVRVGITCALCHSTVDPETRQVIHGAPNSDLRIGLLLALAADSAAFAAHTGVGEAAPREEAVDRALLAWPPGMFDATRDGVANPTRIADVFTRDEAAFGWDGAGRGGLAQFVDVAAGLHPIGAAETTAGPATAQATAAWLATLAPPEVAVDAEAAELGREVFVRGGCEGCHAGPRAQAVDVGSDPARSRAGYKPPGLLGLWWRAPYLHDGGLAVGPGEAIVGVGDTRALGLPIDPRGSLRALVDRDLRARVVAANRTDAARWDSHVRGVGHAFWVDPAAGFSPAEQRMLIEYLLSIRPARP